MNALIYPSVIKGIIEAPSSKSIMQRLCALALLHNGDTIIYRPDFSNDSVVALNIIEKLGAVVIREKDSVHIKGNPEISYEGELNFGESGLSCRMFLPIAALSCNKIVINGEGSLLNRPMTFFDEVLPVLGVLVLCKDAKLPMVIKGPLGTQRIQVDGKESSQGITGLLFAFAARVRANTAMSILNIVSRPYIDLSLSLLEPFGMSAKWMTDDRIFIFPRKELNKEVVVTVEGDWSNAAFLLVAAVLCGEITLENLNQQSVQGDKKILEIFKQAGIQFVLKDHSVAVSAQRNYRGVESDLSHTPDLFPPLVVLAAYAKGQSRLKGVNRLIHKESNRAEELIKVFQKLGVNISQQGDDLVVEGSGMMKGGDVDGANDHRIVMAASIAALAAKEPINISGAEAVSKSFPAFFDVLKQLGAQVSLT